MPLWNQLFRLPDSPTLIQASSFCFEKTITIKTKFISELVVKEKQLFSGDACAYQKFQLFKEINRDGKRQVRFEMDRDELRESSEKLRDILARTKDIMKEVENLIN